MPTAKKIVKKTKPSKASIVNGLKSFRQKRLDKETLEKAIPTQQVELIEMLRAFDPDNQGVVYDPTDDSKGAAYVQQNEGTLVWLPENIIEWLKKPQNKKMWLACSSRVFDINKFEAEIANGNIDKKLVKKFQKKTDPAKPFVRFGKIKKGENL